MLKMRKYTLTKCDQKEILYIDDLLNAYDLMLLNLNILIIMSLDVGSGNNTKLKNILNFIKETSSSSKLDGAISHR